MVKKIDSQALELANRALGLTGAGSRVTELNDGIVDQTLSVGDIVRRSRVLGLTGIFNGVLRNINLGSDTITTSITPYAIGTVAGVAPWPNPIPPGFDLWILYATVRIFSGAPLTGQATLNVRYAANQGFGIDSAGAQVLTAQDQRLAYWDVFVTLGTVFGIQNAVAGPLAKLGIRLPADAGTQINFITAQGAAACGFELQMAIGMFPTALGQDGISI